MTCIFTTGCQGGSGAISENPALLPVDGEWIVNGPPEVDDFFPSGTQNPGTTPIVLVFSETMQGETLVGAFELVRGGTPGPPVQGLAQALVSDGRVLLLFPPASSPLEAGSYDLRLAEEASPLDLTGQELEADEGEQLGTFTVAATPPAAPRLVTTFPPDGADDQSETTEIVAVFDRPVEEQSVDPVSFDVRVNGANPPNDPPATPVRVQLGSASAVDTRAFLYRSLGTNGLPAPLGRDAEVELRLSPAGSPIEDEDGDALAPATITFRTLAIAVPLSASLLSDPSDAIGLANLTDGDPEELTIEVELEGGEPNDAIDVFVFGEQRTTEPDAPLIALQRELRLSGTPPITSALFTREILNLQLSTAPADVRFADGPVTFAFRARRGDAITPLRVLDLDPDPELIQDPVLDTSAPSVASLIGSNDTETFRSDLRGVSLAGDADEELRSVEVTTPLGTNGALAPVVGSDQGGLFLAAPVAIGQVPGGATTYTFVARDSALNAAPARDGDFTQVGSLGPTAFAPGQALEVEVHDARTLAALPGARVMVHGDHGNGVDYPFFAAGVTLADGKVSLTTPGAPAVRVIVTVELAGFDLFTLHGVPSTRVSVPLRESSQPSARASGTVTTSDAAAVALLEGLDRRYDDSRRAVELPRGFPGGACTPIQGVLSCTFGPEAIAELELGARSFFAGDFTQTEESFQTSLLLRAFAFSAPLAPAAENALQASTFEVPFLLDDPATPPEEVALPVPAFTFVVAPGTGVDLATPADDPATTGVPFVTVETIVPGLSGSIAVGQGLAFDQGGNRWTIRAAMPGAITAGGSLGSIGAVDTDPFVRVEVADQAGNAAGIRPRLSLLGAGPEITALAVPSVLAPAAGAQTGGQAFTILLRHAIDDSRPGDGLYRVELEDDAGRRWTLWRFDPSGTADVEVRVVDVGDAGSPGLSDGSVVARASAYAWIPLVRTDFFWTDVEREFELFARAAPLSFVKP